MEAKSFRGILWHIMALWLKVLLIIDWIFFNMPSIWGEMNENLALLRELGRQRTRLKDRWWAKTAGVATPQNQERQSHLIIIENEIEFEYRCFNVCWMWSVLNVIAIVIVIVIRITLFVYLPFIYEPAQFHRQRNRNVLGSNIFQ